MVNVLVFYDYMVFEIKMATIHRTVKNPSWRYRKHWSLFENQVQEIKRIKAIRLKLFLELEAITLHSLAKKYDVGYNTIERCTKLEWKKSLFPYEVMEILRAKKRRTEIYKELAKMKDSVLAIEYGVSMSTISRI